MKVQVVDKIAKMLDKHLENIFDFSWGSYDIDLCYDDDLEEYNDLSVQSGVDATLSR